MSTPRFIAWLGLRNQHVREGDQFILNPATWDCEVKTSLEEVEDFEVSVKQHAQKWKHASD